MLPVFIISMLILPAVAATLHSEKMFHYIICFHTLPFSFSWLFIGHCLRQLAVIAACCCHWLPLPPACRAAADKAELGYVIFATLTLLLFSAGYG